VKAVGGAESAVPDVSRRVNEENKMRSLAFATMLFVGAGVNAVGQIAPAAE
jgi:hypothetical protein